MSARKLVEFLRVGYQIETTNHAPICRPTDEREPALTWFDSGAASRKPANQLSELSAALR